MKYIVLLDSSNTSLTVALATETALIDSTSYEAWQCQSEHMIPELDKLLVKHNVSKDDIEKVILSIGPGSYTGVRIALTIAKTIAISSNAKVYPVSSLRIEKRGKKPSICLINARSGRSYFGVYEGCSTIENDQILTNEEVLKYIKEHPKYVVCGDTEYLGVEGYKADYAVEMFSLIHSLEEFENPINLKPAYMKD